MSNTAIINVALKSLLLCYFCCCSTLWNPVHGFTVNPAISVARQQILVTTNDGGIHNRAGRRQLMVLRMSDPNSSESATTKRRVIEKTDDEWKDILTPDQYYILRKEGTETAGASMLNNISVTKNGADDEGTFCCAGCNNPLFVADTKFDSGTGWPSFYSPVTNSAVDLNTDFKLIVPRTECVCSQCGGHLGHVFEGTFTIISTVCIFEYYTVIIRYTVTMIMIISIIIIIVLLVEFL